MRAGLSSIMAGALLLCLSLPARASTIVVNTAGTDVATFAPGQSVTTTTGGPWDDILFNWYDPTNAPTAVGTLFLLDEAYAGTAADLSSSTPGFIAASSSIVGGVYVFDPSVTLQPLTQYFFYADTDITTRGSGSNTYAGGNLYAPIVNDITNPFVSLPQQDANFQLQGSVVAEIIPVPEPASLTLLGLALAGMGARRWRQRKRRWPPEFSRRLAHAAALQQNDYQRCF